MMHVDFQVSLNEEIKVQWSIVLKVQALEFKVNSINN